MGDHAIFGQKWVIIPFLVVWEGVLINHPSCNGVKCVEKVFKKNPLKLNTASHNTSWYTNTGGFLEHSHSGGSLYYKFPTFQKIIPFLGGPRLYSIDLELCFSNLSYILKITF